MLQAVISHIIFNHNITSVDLIIGFERRHNKHFKNLQKNSCEFYTCYMYAKYSTIKHSLIFNNMHRSYNNNNHNKTSNNILCRFHFNNVLNIIDMA